MGSFVLKSELKIMNRTIGYSYQPHFRGYEINVFLFFFN